MPGDQIVVDVWFARRPGRHAYGAWGSGQDGNDYLALKESLLKNPITLEASSASGEVHSEELMVRVEEDPLLRDIPEWFGDAKFGLFMHWGVFAVPGWARKSSISLKELWWSYTDRIVIQPQALTQSGTGKRPGWKRK